MTDERDIKHANVILSIRWPDASIGEVVKYRPVVGEWLGALDWEKTADGWRPLEWVTASRRYLTREGTHRDR